MSRAFFRGRRPRFHPHRFDVWVRGVGAAAVLSAGCSEIVGANFDKAHPENVGSGGTGGSHSGTGASGGADASPAGGGMQGGAPSGGAASGGEPGSGGDSSGGAASSGGEVGAGGATGDACVPSTWCRDGDGDGSGTPDGSVVACQPPDADWVARCDDCDDANDAVHPGAECGSSSYVPMGGSAPSFDYDCDGNEDECGTFQKAAASCGVVGPLNCAGGGYLPNPSRAATAEQNPFCGSTAYRNCVSVGLPCVAQEATKPAVTCR